MHKTPLQKQRNITNRSILAGRYEERDDKQEESKEESADRSFVIVPVLNSTKTEKALQYARFCSWNALSVVSFCIAVLSWCAAWCICGCCMWARDHYMFAPDPRGEVLRRNEAARNSSTFLHGASVAVAEQTLTLG